MVPAMAAFHIRRLCIGIPQTLARNCTNRTNLCYSQVHRKLCSCLNTSSNVSFKKKVSDISPFWNPSYLQRSNVSTQGTTKVSKTMGPITWKGFLLCLVAGGGVVYYARHLKVEKEKEKEKVQRRSVGMASLGGPFELTDQDGNIKTDKDFLGQWVLIYFGFTHCPDICPDQLDKITSIIEILDKTEGLPKLQPLFITVDPRRDNPKNIKEYLKDFHPRFIGLSGNEAEIKSITKAYRVYYSAGPMDEDEDYIVDHTIITYLIGPDGKFVEYFGQNKTIEETTSTIGTRMINQKLNKK